MSTSWEYGDVSPARYPNPGRKRKSAKSSDPARKKKKKKKKKKEKGKTPVIQNMTPVGLEAFKNNEATYLGETPNDDSSTVEVVQEGVSYPQPNEKETQDTVQELMNELNDMVDQATQTPPPQFTLTKVYDSPEEFAEAKRQTPPPPAKDDNEGMKRLVRMATIFQSPGFQNPRPRPPPSSVDYMVCPWHKVRLEECQSQKGWDYVKCPIQPCLLFCGKDQAYEYMKAVYRQPHPDVLDMWSCLLCFCREPATLQQSHSPENPDRLFVTCTKKKCNFFRWADQPLGQKYWKWFHDNPPKRADHQAEHPLPSRDANGYPKRGYDIPGPPPRVRCKEEVERERPLTDYEEQLLREIQELKNRQEVLMAPAPPPPK